LCLNASQGKLPGAAGGVCFYALVLRNHIQPGASFTLPVQAQRQISTCVFVEPKKRTSFKSSMAWASARVPGSLGPTQEFAFPISLSEFPKLEFQCGYLRKLFVGEPRTRTLNIVYCGRAGFVRVPARLLTSPSGATRGTTRSKNCPPKTRALYTSWCLNFSPWGGLKSSSWRTTSLPRRIGAYRTSKGGWLSS